MTSARLTGEMAPLTVCALTRFEKSARQNANNKKETNKKNQSLFCQ